MSNTRLTLEQKILLHLLKYFHYNAFSLQMDWALSQPGIADSIGAIRGEIPRTMKKLLKKNYVVERRGHVTGFKRMVKVYSLTWEGKIEAERLIKLMENEVITLIDENGSYNKLKIGEVLKKTSISITEIIKYSKEDVFDMRVFHKKVSEVKEEEKRHFYELPKIGQFFNRDRELKMLKEFVDAGLPKFIIVYGIPGIGKTTLISKFLSGYNTNVFYYRIHQLESVRSLLSAVSGFLSRIGKQKLSSYLSKEINIDLHKVLSIFEEEINEMNIIFVIDDFERAEGEILWLFSSFFSIAEKLKNTKFIIITRDLIRFYTQIDIKTKKLVVELQITGLDFENSRKLILSRSPGKWSDISLLNIHKLTAGHPFYLELIERENENVETDFWSFMSKEVFARLKESEANLLGIASVFRTPVSADALFVEDWVNYETIEKLVSKSLLREPYPQTYEIYNQISDFFYSRLPPTKKKKCHVYAADYYLKMVDDLSIIEAIYHLIRSDEQKKAAKLLGERGLSLLKKGYLEELNSLIKELDERKINDEDARRITTMRNDILDIWGRWDNIFEYRRQSLFLASRLKKDIKREILLEKIGYVLWKKHEFDEGICNLMKSARTLEKIGDKEGLAEINRNIGWIFWLKNEKDKAVEYYSEASKIAKRVNNLNIMKRINFECGHIYCESGDFEKSLANYEAAIKIANSKNDVHDLVRGYDYIANLYMNKNDLENAFGYLEKSSATAERVLFSSGKAYSLLHLSDYWFDKKKFDVAGKCLEESIKLFNKLNDRLGICYVHSHFGILYKYNNEIEKSINSFKAAVSNIKQSEFPYYVEELNDEIARLSKLVDVRIWKK